jgi:hypothetical protein
MGAFPSNLQRGLTKSAAFSNFWQPSHWSPRASYDVQKERQKRNEETLLLKLHQTRSWGKFLPHNDRLKIYANRQK